MQSISDGVTTAPRRVKDARLERVLDGGEYLVFDGAMGTMLQRGGLVEGGELPELLCLRDPEAVTAVHRAYVEAGSQVVTTNTFGANRLKLEGETTVDEVFAAAVACARASAAPYVAADIGPTGQMLEPFGEMSLEEAHELFAEQARAAVAAGADLIIIETISDLEEAKAAVSAVRECSDLPLFATMTFGKGGRTLFGTAPSEAARVLDEYGADAIGINCSLGPVDLEPLVRDMIAATSRPVIVQANAGLPSVVGGETVYSVDAGAYAAALVPIIDDGATVIGGCCGTDPAYISEIANLLDGRMPTPRDVG